MAGTVGEEKVRVLTGADVCRVDVREPDSRLFESYLNRLPEVELEVAVMMVKKDFFCVCRKLLLKDICYVFAYLIAVGTDGRTDDADHVRWRGAIVFCHGFDDFFTDAGGCSSPA